MKHAIVLVGPKGAGKSTIGTLLEQALGVRFVRVESEFLAVRDALGPVHPDLERQGFEAVNSRLLAELASADTICFESTGASSHFSAPALIVQQVRELLEKARAMPN